MPAQIELLQLHAVRMESERAEAWHLRVIASVSGDLQAMVCRGRLRQELCERLGAVEITVAAAAGADGGFCRDGATILERIAQQYGS